MRTGRPIRMAPGLLLQHGDSAAPDVRVYARAAFDGEIVLANWAAHAGLQLCANQAKRNAAVLIGKRKLAGGTAHGDVSRCPEFAAELHIAHVLDVAGAAKSLRRPNVGDGRLREPGSA